MGRRWVVVLSPSCLRNSPLLSLSSCRRWGEGQEQCRQKKGQAQHKHHWGMHSRDFGTPYSFDLHLLAFLVRTTLEYLVNLGSALSPPSVGCAFCGFLFPFWMLATTVLGPLCDGRRREERGVASGGQGVLGRDDAVVRGVPGHPAVRRRWGCPVHGSSVHDSSDAMPDSHAPFCSAPPQGQKGDGGANEKCPSLSLR